jgi:hypothetical protein
MAELRQHRGSTSFFEATAPQPSNITINPFEEDDEATTISVSSQQVRSQRPRSSIAGLQEIASHDRADKSKYVADSFVFAFDIDGVLIRGGKPIPEAIEAMKVLDGMNEYNLVV